MRLLLALLLLATPALADPVGSFSVTGPAEGGGIYEGTVTVTRTGETYRVVWLIAGDRFVGTGFGGIVVEGGLVLGAADPSDTLLAVAYTAPGGSTGLAVTIDGGDGTWVGRWTPGGGNTVQGEVWQPRTR
jgi:hypothetical protein